LILEICHVFLRSKFEPDTEIGKKEGFRSGTNYSAAIHQDGEKPVLFVPYFFRELLGFLLNWRKQRPKGLKPFASFSEKSLRISHPRKNKCHFTKGPFYG
jgi:hypothetical protein